MSEHYAVAYLSSHELLHLAVERFSLTPMSLLGRLMGVDERAVLRDADLLGRIIDTYVVAQLRPELELMVPRPQLLHLRDTNGDHEVDLLIELTRDLVCADRCSLELSWLAPILPGETTHRGVRERPG